MDIRSTAKVDAVPRSNPNPNNHCLHAASPHELEAPRLKMEQQISDYKTVLTLCLILLLLRDHLCQLGDCWLLFKTGCKDTLSLKLDTGYTCTNTHVHRHRHTITLFLLSNCSPKLSLSKVLFSPLVPGCCEFHCFLTMQFLSDLSSQCDICAMFVWLKWVQWVFWYHYNES